MADDDLTNREWNILLKACVARGMTRSGAAAYLSALIQFCEKAKEKYGDLERNGA